MTFRTHRIAPAAALLLSATLVGCGAQPGNTLVQYERGDTGDIIVPAPADGMAALYSGNDLNPNVRVPVDEGDDVGFRDQRDEAGEGVIKAVAGDFERDIDPGVVFDREYFWKFQTEDEN